MARIHASLLRANPRSLPSSNFFGSHSWSNRAIVFRSLRQASCPQGCNAYIKSIREHFGTAKDRLTEIRLPCD
eukprot:9475936-Pyramimonas_sp.AAC.4